MAQSALIVGAGLGGLSTALRLASQGYKVTIIEKHNKPGGRLNILQSEGFTFDMGPSFFSMSYEFKEMFKSCGVPDPLRYNELDPLYAVYFANKEKPYYIHKDLEKLAGEFPNEKDFVAKINRYLKGADSIFHDTEYRIVKRNYDSLFDYAKALASVPLKHSPKLLRTMWEELSKHFETEEVKIIFSLVAFFLGATPFDTPAVYSLLNYTELVHDGYWNVKGGMYSIVTSMVKLLEEKGVDIVLNTEVVAVEAMPGIVEGFKDQNGKIWKADFYVVNGDAASFRGKILGRKKFAEPELDKMKWTLAPFTIYLGVKGKVPNLHHHNYFLGSNFKDYAGSIFRSSVSPEKPYYYVNVSSKSNPECAPEGCENIFILCPVPDLRFKESWTDARSLADNILEDMKERTGFDFKANTLTETILTPIEWRNMFNLYKGSGLGLAHDLNQVGGMRPKNKDEYFNNLYYVGASTVPGTGLPIVVISSRLVMERIQKEHPLTQAPVLETV